MTASKCQRCGHYWSHNTGTQVFSLITRFCPDCLARMLPLLDVTPLSRRAAS